VTHWPTKTDPGRILGAGIKTIEEAKALIEADYARQ
jgi:hypothetical protein